MADRYCTRLHSTKQRKGPKGGQLKTALSKFIKRYSKSKNLREETIYNLNKIIRQKGITVVGTDKNGRMLKNIVSKIQSTK